MAARLAVTPEVHFTTPSTSDRVQRRQDCCRPDIFPRRVKWAYGIRKRTRPPGQCSWRPLKRVLVGWRLLNDPRKPAPALNLRFFESRLYPQLYPRFERATPYKK